MRPDSRATPRPMPHRVRPAMYLDSCERRPRNVLLCRNVRGHDGVVVSGSYAHVNRNSRTSTMVNGSAVDRFRTIVGERGRRFCLRSLGSAGKAFIGGRILTCGRGGRLGSGSVVEFTSIGCQFMWLLRVDSLGFVVEGGCLAKGLEEPREFTRCGGVL